MFWSGSCWGSYVDVVLYWNEVFCWCSGRVFGFEEECVLRSSWEREVFLFCCDLVGNVLLILWGYVVVIN